MGLDEDLRTVADAAVRYCADGEELAGIVPAEPGSGVRVYVCAYRDGDRTSWLVLDADAEPVEDRSLVRDAVSIAALYELADEVAASDGEPEERAAPGGEPGARCRTPAALDALGAAAEDRGAFLEAMKQATGTVDELLRD